MLIDHPRRSNKIETLAPLKLNGTEIKWLKKTNTLGVIVDKNLSWNEHFKSWKGNVASGLSALKKKFFHNLSCLRFTMRWLKVASDTEICLGHAANGTEQDFLNLWKARLKEGFHLSELKAWN